MKSPWLTSYQWGKFLKVYLLLMQEKRQQCPQMYAISIQRTTESSSQSSSARKRIKGYSNMKGIKLSLFENHDCFFKNPKQKH